MVSLAGIWSKMLLCSPHMSYSLCPCSPMIPNRPVGSVFGVRAARVLGGRTPSACLSAVLGGVHSVSRAVGMEAAHPPFRIDEGPGGTGVMLLPTSPAAGLQMGAFRW